MEELSHLFESKSERKRASEEKWQAQREKIVERKKKRKLAELIPKVEKRELKTTDQNLPETKQCSLPDLQTLSIAVPVSIIANCQSVELRSYVAGQIARSAAIYGVSEIIVFQDSTANDQVSDQFVHILNYVECPQYLRKSLFPFHPFLRHVGLINPLDSPHHLRADESSAYREGVVKEQPTKEGQEKSHVDIGLQKACKIGMKLDPGTRVTVKLGEEHKKRFDGTVVSPLEPVAAMKKYWGYQVRTCQTFSEVFSKCSYKGGYDLVIGTSDKGTNCSDIKEDAKAKKHVVIVFGGLEGLEVCIESDASLEQHQDISSLFHYYINTCPNQGTRTIRTEEAILISLAVLTPLLGNSS